MADYIRRDLVLDIINTVNDTGGFTGYADYCTLFDEIDTMPAADVQPVKRGKWCPPLMGQGKCDTYCERCHGKIMRNSTGIFEETPYCPHCGADMKEADATKSKFRVFLRSRL